MIHVVSSLMKMFNGLPYVKTKIVSAEKTLLVEEIKEAVENLKLVRKGKIKAKPARELLDQL